MEINRNRQPHETMQQFRGRVKRETNAANDALDLEVGEPILYGSRKTRFQLSLVDRHRPSPMKRLEGEDLASFLTSEQAKAKEDATRQQRISEYEAFRSRPEVQDADTVRHIIEGRLKDVIDRLTPAEWAEFRKRLEA